MARCRKDGCEEQPGKRLKFDAGRVATTDAQGRRRGVLSFQDGHPGEGPACQAPFGGARRPRTRMKDGVPVPGFDRATPARDVFACFLRHGIRPFPNVEGWTLDSAIDRLDACLAVPVETVEFVRPDPRIGVNIPALFFKADEPGRRDDDARTVDKYNYPPNVMFDLARLGVGALRHIQEPDLAWLHLIGDDVPIAAPDDMRDMLPRLNWMAFGRFTYTVITCLYTGQRIIPLLFGYGGGSNVPRDDVMPARPKFQKDPYIPVRAGWDEWYWGFTTHSSAAVTYQQYALNLFFREDPGPGSYAQQCCYRKCLGLLTFADPIGEYLELLDGALRACSDGAVTLTDIVPAVGCGNEMDTFYGSPLAQEDWDALPEHVERIIGAYSLIQKARIEALEERV